MAENNYNNLSYCYGRARLKYLQQEHPELYKQMVENGTLDEHLYNIEKNAMEMEDRLIEQTMKKEGVDENLKMSDPMQWVGLVNNIKHRVRELVQSELVYV